MRKVASASSLVWVGRLILMCTSPCGARRTRLPVYRQVIRRGPKIGRAFLSGVACLEFADGDHACSQVHDQSVM
ncbi:hypothetical protein F5148DRAFT_1194818 [Russula earlei]|uniref:Uncharacterized protein n=1 Tax=Russula earlei TaxID=71964 RepID=A0ACC0UBK4_9AGAM|nr:hypothetical protein F5148DRAFT_1194818 [Russula earlei]